MYVNVEHYVLACCKLLFYLRLQCAVVSVGIYLLELHELIVLYFLAELVWCEEEILHSVLLLSARRARGAADGEVHVKFRMLLHQPVYDCLLAAA